MYPISNFVYKNGKTNFYSGDIKKIDTLIGAGLESSDIIIVHSENDIDSLFIAQKSKINAY